jgi:hypothetical protein
MSLQIDFFARDEMITVVPNFSIPTADKSVACIMVCFSKEVLVLNTFGL